MFRINGIGFDRVIKLGRGTSKYSPSDTTYIEIGYTGNKPYMCVSPRGYLVLILQGDDLKRPKAVRVLYEKMLERFPEGVGKCRLYRYGRKTEEIVDLSLEFGREAIDRRINDYMVPWERINYYPIDVKNLDKGKTVVEFACDGEKCAYFNNDYVGCGKLLNYNIEDWQHAAFYRKEDSGITNLYLPIGEESYGWFLPVINLPVINRRNNYV